MTGRKPEGGDERKTFSCSTHERSCNSTKTPQCFLSKLCFYCTCPFLLKWSKEHIKALKPIPSHSVKDINTQKWLSWSAWMAYALLSLFHSPRILHLFFFFPSSFQEATCSPCSRHQKVSHLPLITFGCSWLAASHLGWCGVSARFSLPRRLWGSGEGVYAGTGVNWVGRLYWRIARVVF